MTTTTLSNGQTLDNATILLGNIDLQTDNTDVYLQGTLDVAGTYSMASVGDNTDLILDSATVDLTGGGFIQLSDSGANRIYGVSASDDVLINNDTIEGSGQLGVNNGNIPLALTNATHGVINATGTAGYLIIQPGGPALLNQGLIEDTGPAGLLISNGAVIDQTGGTVLASGNNVYLENGAAIAGGVLKSSGGGIIEVTGGGGTLDGASNGVITIAAASTVQLEDNQNLFLLGNIDNLGTLGLNSAGDSTNLILNSATVSLTGGGVVVLSNTGANRIYGNGTGTQTLINVNNIIEGAGQLGVNNGNDPLALTNEGTIDADDSASLIIQPGGPAVLNEKLIEATGAGGLVLTNGGVIDQSGGTLLAKGTGDNVYLQGGADVAGGLLLGTLGGIIETSNATLDGTTTGAITIGTSTTVQVQDNTQLDLLGTINILGTLALNSTGDATNLILTGTTVSLIGGGFVQLSDNSANQVFGTSSSQETLINVKDTIEGAGNLGVNSGGLPLALTNQSAGVINANAVAHSLVIQTGGPALVNNGLIEVTNTGGLVITNSSTISQTGGGKILATGSLSYGYFENGADILGGTLLATNGGEFFVAGGGATLGGPSTTSAITIGTATTVQLDDNQQLNLYGIIDNLGTLALDGTNDATSLVLQGATVTLTGGGVVLLSNNSANRIFGNSNTQQSLINLNNTIEGAGQIGINSSNNPLALTNKAVIDANGTSSLVIEPGGPALLNEGTMEATGAGGLVITNNAVVDQYNGPSIAVGTLLASGTGNDVYLQGNADIVGGLLLGTGGGVIQTSNATLDGSEGAAVTVGTSTTVQIDDNTQLDLLGTINNLGTLALGSTNDATQIILQSPTVTLTGGGVVLLSNDYGNEIYGANTTDDTLINLNNTIEGGGDLGVNNGSVPLALINESVIDANTANALVIEPGGPAVINEGLMEATGAGALVITDNSVIDQFNGPSAAVGTLRASTADVYLQGNADIVGGLLLGTGGGDFQTSNATLDGSEGAAITIGTATSVQINDNTALHLLGTINNLGTLALDSTNDATQILLQSPTVVLTGGGVVLLSNDYANQIFGDNSNDGTLINLNNTIEGAGDLGVNDGNIPLALTNESLIDADGTDSLIVEPGGPALLNEGLMEDTGTGGLVITDGAVIDQYNGPSIALGTLLASGSGDNVYLQGNADVVGGILLGTGGGEFLTSNATLDGSESAAITIAAATTVQVDDNTALNLLGTIVLLGTLAQASTGDGTVLLLQSGTVDLTGGGVLMLSNSSANEIYGANSSDGVLINNDTIEGAGLLGVNDGNIPLALTNAVGGLVDADDSTALIIQPGGPAVVNKSLMEATGTGGLVITNGAVVNQYNGPSAAVGTILASGAGDNVYIQGGADIVGGLLQGTAGGIIEISNGTLDGSEGGAVTIGASTTVQFNDNSNLYLFGTVNNLGTLSQDSTGDGTVILLETPTVSLTGGGVLLLSNTQANQIYGANPTDDTLVNVNNTIEGAGRLGVNDGNIPLNLINDGVVDANASAGMLIQTGGPSVTNAGLLEATAGAVLTIDNTGVTNTATGTIAAYDSSTVQFDSNADLINEVAGTLTGGEYAAYAVSASSALNITGSGTLAVDAANIILSGTGAEISFWNSNAYQAIETSLTEVTGAGTLQMDNNKIYSTTNTLTIDAGGHLDLAAGTLVPGALLNSGTVFGNGVITGGVSNAARIEASGGTLIVTGGVSGTGSIVIDSGAAFELGSASANAVDFGAGTVHSGALTGDLLILEHPSLYTGTLTSLAPGDTIDLVGTTAKSATISGNSLIVSLTAGGTLSYALSGANALDRAVTASDSHGGSDVTIFAKATAGAISPTPVNFGEKHAGSVLTQTYTIANSGGFDQYSEYLDASFGSHSASLTDSGSFTGLKPGSTNSSSLITTLVSTAGGLITGTANVNLYTDGTSVPGDGLGTIQIGTDTVTLTGTIFNYATATATPHGAGLEAHVGSAITQVVTIANSAAAGIYSENLDARISGTSTDLTSSGTISELAAGSTNSTSLALTLNSGAAGAESGTATLGLISDGSGIDTLGTTTLASQTVTVTGTLFNLATASAVAPNPIAFGEAHVGSALSHFLTIANAAATGIYSENLDAKFSGTSADLIAVGSVSELAAGSTSTNGLDLTLSGTAGVNTGSATIGLLSDGSTIDTLGTTTLASQTVSVSGTLFNYATASGLSAVSFGEKHVGTALTKHLTIANQAAAGIYSENLDAKFSGTSSDITTSGTVSELAAGGSNTALVLTLASGTAGVQTGSATIGLVSDGSTIDTLGTTTLAGQTVAVSGTLFNYATASTATPVSFGIVHVGQAVTKYIALSNTAAAGSYSEKLNASLSGTSSDFTTSGTISGLAAGATSTTNLHVTIATGSAGVESGTTTLGLVSSGAGIDTLGTTVLAGETVVLTGTVNNYATATIETISGPGVLSGSGTSYSINLGSVTKGHTALKENIGILNSATGPADSLSGSLSLSGTTGFKNSGDAAFSGKAAGQADTSPIITLTTGTLGTFTETIVIHAKGANASGYSGTLAAETLTVTGTVVAAAAVVPASDAATIAASPTAIAFATPAAAGTASKSAAPLTGTDAAARIFALHPDATPGLAAWLNTLAAHAQTRLASADTPAVSGIVTPFHGNELLRPTLLTVARAGFAAHG